MAKTGKHLSKFARGTIEKIEKTIEKITPIGEGSNLAKQAVTTSIETLLAADDEPETL